MVSNSNFEEITFEAQYKNLLKEKKEIDFLFVGQDPYPKGSNGVAFCKNSHYEFFQDDCCGNCVTTSLGLTKEQIRTEYKNPKVLFLDLLLTRNIAFINVCSKLLSNLNEFELEKAISDTKEEYDNILRKAKKIILLGKGKTRSYFEKYYSEFKYDTVLLHPSKKAKKDNENEWMEIWGNNYLEKNILNVKPHTGIKVIGKIDLSQFEKPKKEISKDKQNIYIIDTNVFVHCPDIISKIDKQYQIVLSAKVIDELDYLKVKLKEEEKKNVEKALRQINENRKKRNLRFELSEISLLPDDLDKKSPDNLILSVALKYKDENPIMLTSDNGLQIKVSIFNITTITLHEFLKQMK
jgi:rRNA-processing protein FCF1